MAENTIIHEISLAGYKATSTGGMLDLGTWGSYGIEKLHLTLDAAWQDLTITAFFNVKGEVVGKALVGKDGYADVPWEATKENTFAGRIVFEGSMNNQRRISANLNFKVTNHSEFEDSDPVPTDDRWNQFVTQNKEYRDGAYEAAERANARAEDAEVASEGAQAAARAAKASENAAAASASNAAADAAKAGQYAKAAQAAQEAAENAAAAAAASESAADTLAAKAERAAQEAENSNTAANNAAYLAGENATAAQQAAENAAAAANYAGQSASDAAASKAAAETAAQAAQEAQAAAAAARDDAVKAQTAAQTAAKTAQDAQNAAEKARDDAQTAQQGAEAARDAAAGSAEAAAKSEENAKQSANTLAESVENVVANTAAVAELKQQVANITPDDSTIGDKPWSSKHIIDMLFPPLEESGNPVVCYPVAGYPLGVKASWEPVQEGSGTPYPAGGGPNKLNVAGVVSSRTISGITFTINPDGTIGVNGTSTATCFLNPNTKFNKAYLQKIPAGAYRFDFEQTALSIFLFGYYEDGSEAPIVYAGNVVTYAQDAYIGMQIRVAAGVTVNTTARLMLHTGTSTPSAYAGWENIRPIKGRDSVTVERCGENLLNIKPFKKDPYKGITYEYVPDGGIHISGTATASVDSQTFPIWHLPPGKYYGLETGEEISASIVVQRNGKNLWINAKKEFTILAGDVTKYWYMITSTGVTVDKTVYPYIVPGTTPPTVYTPYTGQTNTLTLPETVYGGEVDAVTGDGKETWKTITLDGTEDCSFQTTNSPGKSGFVFQVPEIATPEYPENKGDIVCSQYPTVTANDTYTCKNGISVESGNNHYFRIYSDIYAEGTVDEWKSYLATQYAAGTPVQIAYKLAEPVPFTATGAQPMPALAGVNTVLTDADSATVTGRADPIKRITDLEDAVASQT